MDGTLVLSIFEEGIDPEFRLSFENWKTSLPAALTLAKQFTVTTIRSNGKSQVFQFKPLQSSSSGSVVLRSTVSIPEPHDFHVEIRYRNGQTQQMELYSVDFRESHEEDHHQAVEVVDRVKEKQRKRMKYEQDNNFRAAVLHVVADAFVSVITILSIVIAGTTSAWWTNPMAGIIGSLVIISWGIQLIADTTSTLLDISPDPRLNEKLTQILESDQMTHVTDLHVWKLGPGKLGMVASLATDVEGRERNYYARQLKKYKVLSHVTIEVHHLAATVSSSPSGKSVKNVLHIDHDHDHGYDQGNDYGHNHDHDHRH